MSLCRFLPTPSDRMGVLWSLLGIEESVVLEYGPTGTTHYSISFFSGLGIDRQHNLFASHMEENDVIMGDSSKLEKSIFEIDTTYKPKVIFVLASSISSTIGTDLAGICQMLEDEVSAKLIPIENGGLSGEFNIGERAINEILAKQIVKNSDEKLDKTFNILGGTYNDYRIRSDINEIKRLMQNSFGYSLLSSFTVDSSISEIQNVSKAKINIVISENALTSAKYLEKKYGIPYIYMKPYGYKNTIKFLEEISKVIEIPINEKAIVDINKKILKTNSYKMYKFMLKDNIPQITILGDMDIVAGISSAMEELGFDISNKICNHSLKADIYNQYNITKFKKEKDKISLLKSLQYQLIFGDDISLSLCDDTNEKLTICNPVIFKSQKCTHMPFVGEYGMDFIIEHIDSYIKKLS